ncbi:MAG: HAD family phosphatase [Anaerolineales bacterium]|nr:HAD family phosphatase [Anaerolineales bacterium]MCS7246647.1 HAD family phosphatase [Anaerolineales bacterium]MDW8160457.1 HAD family phosphatase [Anaerolineales bacterium]MDW8446071.1 HAD family phosphatase [Anaerolineales bacterium]
MAIGTILFDFGGVLLRTEDRRPRQKLAAKYGLDEEDLIYLVFGSPSALSATVGKITAEQHWRQVAAALGATEAQIPLIREQFFAGDRLDEELLQFIRSHRQTHRIGLLSNAWDDMRRILNDELGILTLFDDVIISAEVGLMKPDRSIYELAAQRFNTPLSEMVFVDDLPVNVQAAREAGMNSFQFRSTAQTIHDLQRLLEEES